MLWFEQEKIGKSHIYIFELGEAFEISKNLFFNIETLDFIDGFWLSSLTQTSFRNNMPIYHSFCSHFHLIMSYVPH